jgi:hypothetical protein
VPFEDLLGSGQINEALAASEELPPRPAHTLPEFAITGQGKVLQLKRMTPKEWDHFGFKRITGCGWPGWYPIEDSDRAAWATRKKGRTIVKPKPEEVVPDDYLVRRSKKQGPPDFPEGPC